MPRPTAALDAVAPAATRTLATLDRSTCLALLAGQPVGRVVFTHRALPVILPVNFLLDDEGVLLRIRPGSALATVARGVVVAFESDYVDVGARTGWSVTVVGRADEVTDPVLRERVLAALSPWAGGDRDHVVRVRLEQVTGRRLLPTASAAG